MKNIFLISILFSILFYGCKEDLEQKVIMMPPASSQQFSSTVNTVVLTPENKQEGVITFNFKAPDYGIKVLPSYTLQFALPKDTSGANGWLNVAEVKLTSDDGNQKVMKGVDLNFIMATRLKLPLYEASKVAVRLKTDVNQNSGVGSTIKPLYSVLTLTVTPFRDIVIYPALIVKGGDSWQTPAERENGYVLASAGSNNKYEGYVYLPNADGWNGSGFKLATSFNQDVYGWGSETTIAKGASGNIWYNGPATYAKINVDLDNMSIKYVPVQFFISGDDNGWSTSSTPMTYNVPTKQLVAENVSLTAGKSFVFTSNGNYDISYKVVDNDKKEMVFSGPPNWVGQNIEVEKTGVFTVTLDLSAGDGNYTYSVK